MRGIVEISPRARIVIRGLIPFALAREPPARVAVARDGREREVRYCAVERVCAVLGGGSILGAARLTVVEPIGEPHGVARADEDDWLVIVCVRAA